MDALNGGDKLSAHVGWGCIHCLGYVLPHFKGTGEARFFLVTEMTILGNTALAFVMGVALSSQEKEAPSAGY